MTRTFTVVLGVVLLLVGICGFVLNPGGGLLLGIFMIDSTHNLIHVVSGIAGIAMAMMGASKLYCQIFGAVYLLVGIGGLAMAAPDGMLLGLIHVNGADNILHLAIGAGASYFGFMTETAKA